MTLEELKQEREQLFDEKFTPKIPDAPRIIRFCKELNQITGIQVCMPDGSLYEYLPQVYRSAVKEK